MRNLINTCSLEKFQQKLQQALEGEDFRIDSFREELVRKPGEEYPGLVCMISPSSGENEPQIGISLKKEVLCRKYAEEGVEQTAAYAAEVLKQAYQDRPRISEALESYEYAREHIGMTVIASEGREEFLQTVPHVRICDLAGIFRICIPHAGGTAALTITHSMLTAYGVAEDTVLRDALAAMGNPKLRSMREVLEQDYHLPVLNETDDVSGLWVARGGERFGAAVLLNEEFLKTSAERLGSYYILPSSREELIFLKDTGTQDPYDLLDMVQQINQSEVTPDNFLADAVYYYAAGDGCLIKVAG